MTWDKAHGRVECRELWVTEAAELGRYLEATLGWPGVRQVGLIRRSRRRASRAEWDSTEAWPWVSSLPPERADAATLAAGLRGHWLIEKGLHYVRDVTYGEDRRHARSTGVLLAALRNAALNCLRPLGHRYVPDAHRALSADLPGTLRLLTLTLEH